FCLIPLMPIIILKPSHMNSYDFLQLWLHHLNLLILFAILGYTIFKMTRRRQVYLLDFSCYNHHLPHSSTLTLDKYINTCKLYGTYNDTSIEFMDKILKRSGIGDDTTVPTTMTSLRPDLSLAASRKEAEDMIFDALDNLFANNVDVEPVDIDVLVVNGGTFSPPPSLSAMVMNKYKMRNNVRSFNLSGMGCSSGLIAIDLANNMLQVYKNSYAIVVTTENITNNFYPGNKKQMLVPVCLFRQNCTAILLSNRSSDRWRAKYKLAHLVRTHIGADDLAFKCVYQEEDDDGITGIALSKDVVVMAGGALRRNITTLGPLVLPLRELLRFSVMFVAKKLFNPNMKGYVPNFKLAFEHFCIHAGGKTVINEIQKKLRLSADDVEASRMTLHRFGNASSSSIWYELAYKECKGKVLKGDRVWQIAFGSGFKCNSGVWVALMDVKPCPNNLWEGCISKYPIHLDL
ncbi:3-ketoacyl-CoA synthase 4-like, partial [Cucurbita moschata]|uniref:3-ketoacyl-CoA synthase n=1 Tax=Cucurbita moschata TaxID=3662 RepID=A0A6J1GJ93_CUCMO